MIINKKFSHPILFHPELPNTCDFFYFYYKSKCYISTKHLPCFEDWDRYDKDYWFEKVMNHRLVRQVSVDFFEKTYKTSFNEAIKNIFSPTGD